MSGWRLLALTTACTAAVASSFCATSALADGDPASDVLVAQNVFLPEGQSTSSALAAQLTALAREANQAGSPIKVALIATPADLGSISALYGQPTKYARFLSLELEFVTKAPILVVMPQGIGFARAGKIIPNSRLASLNVSSGPNGLIQTAIAAVDRLEPHLAPPPSPSPRAPVRPASPSSGAPSPRQAAPAGQNGNAITGPSKRSDSFAQVVAERFETGASDPVVWAALGITFALVGLGGFGVYLINEWTPRPPRRR